MILQRSILKGIDRLIGGPLIWLLSRWHTRSLPELLPSIRTILVIRPGGMGDAVLLIPALKALRFTFPNAKVHILAEKRNVGIFQFAMPLDRIFCYDQGLDLFWVFRQHYDMVIDTEQWHRLSAVAAFLTRAPLRCGFATNERAKLFTHPVPYSHQDYETESFLNLVAAIKGTTIPFDPEIPFITVPTPMRIWARNKLGEIGPGGKVVLFPGASVPERRWGTEKFIELGRRLINDGHFIIICGGDADKKAAQTIASSLGERVLNLTGCLSLTQTTAILSEAGLLVTSDSGLMHLAYAVGTPTISLFGAGIEEKWAPRGAKHHVLNKRLPCSPCTRFGYTPPCPYDVECLKRVTVEEVCAAVHKILPADIMKTPGH